MKTTTILFSILLSVLAFNNSLAQNMPLVYEVENTGEDCPEPYMPTISELPSINNLPNPFLWSDGRGSILHYSDWRCRRAEIKAEIEHYEVGEKPAPPEDITASYADNTLTVNVTVNGETLTLTSQVVLPEGEGPFPAIIGMGFGTNLPDSSLTSRNIVTIPFNFGQVMAHTQTRGQEPINDLYPDQTDMGAYSAWPWGVSRLIDGLELVSEDLNIDTEHLGVSGCSFAGKMAIFSGAFDERIALTFGIESGGGGYTTWRFSETLGNVETLGNTSHAWFIEDMFQFSNNVNKLPMDHHEMMAMVAPRALFVTGNPGWTWLADESGYVGSNATKRVYEALGVPDRFAYSQIGGHNHCAIPAEQVPEIEAYLDKFLLGNESVNTNVSTSPYTTNLSNWITWDNPTLLEGTSYFGKTSLVSPIDLADQLETTITFSWNAAGDAQSYDLQLSSDPAFRTVAVSESAITDTVKTINELEKGTKYYWRVRIENSSGDKGPWSNPFNFITSIPLPTAPELIAAGPTSGRADYVELKWNGVEGASNYLVQLSAESDFSTILASGTTSGTATQLNGTSEGVAYYWRVQAKNISGSSSWSNVAEFMVILPPDDLELLYRGSDEINIYWDDNSEIEDGYIIERKLNGQTEFTVIDTTEANKESYDDVDFKSDNTYSYRIKAYKGSNTSGYSNESSLVVTNNEREETGVPTTYFVDQNYPNPFNPVTTITFGVPQTSQVQLNIFNMLGQKVETLVNGRMSAGYHTVTFDASTLSSGVYLYTLQARDFTQTLQLSLIK